MVESTLHPFWSLIFPLLFPSPHTECLAPNAPSAAARLPPPTGCGRRAISCSIWPAFRATLAAGSSRPANSSPWSTIRWCARSTTWTRWKMDRTRAMVSDRCRPALRCVPCWLNHAQSPLQMGAAATATTRTNRSASGRPLPRSSCRCCRPTSRSTATRTGRTSSG